MMKWGRKKQSPSSSPKHRSFSNVFPISWLSKLKQKKKGRQSPRSVSSFRRSSCGEGRFYGGEDAFWRISFEEERVKGKKVTEGVLKSVWYDSDDELEQPLSSFRSCRATATKVGSREQSQKFNGIVSDIRKMREFSEDFKISPEFGHYKGGNKQREAQFKNSRWEFGKDQKLRKMNRRELKDKRLELKKKSDIAEERFKKLEDKDILEMESVKTIQAIARNSASDSRKHRSVPSVNTRNRNLRTIEEDSVEQATKELGLDWQKLKEMKIREIISKSEKQRKSLQIRPKQSRRVRIISPRTASRVEICKMKASEDMKKSKMKMKKKMNEEAVEEIRELGSFAVVKCSFDPQQDFRDSMVEMITEKKLDRPEELEELLACFLTLNCDEYHDMIIKVFRQVWFDLNKASLNPGLQDDHL